MQIVIFVECQIYIWKPDVILSHFKLSRCVFFYCETEQNTSSNSPTNTILLPSSPPLWHPQILIRAQNQKSPLTFLFAWSNPFQNGITSPISPKNHGPARFQGKGLDAGQGLLSGDWAVVLPNQMLLVTKQATPENFVQIGPSVQKLFMVFCSMDRETHKLHTKWITPLPYTGTGRILF